MADAVKPLLNESDDFFRGLWWREKRPAEGIDEKRRSDTHASKKVLQQLF